MEDLLPEEKLKLKTLCDFLFYDLYQYWATFSRFEQCFQPLFNNTNEINFYKIFIEIAGKLKKYITYNRFVEAFLKYKRKKIQVKSDLYIFFDNLFNKILKGINGFVGTHEDYSQNSAKVVYSYSTKKDNNLSELKDSYISQISILNDKYDNIRGIILEYDDLYKYELYQKSIKRQLFKGLEINLNFINENAFKRNRKIFNNIDISLYRDSITHIFGTINKRNNIITFLGFKCISGKTTYIGNPEGESFLFGEFGQKFYNLRLEIKKGSGITLFEPRFIENKRNNYYLNNEIFEDEEDILDENYLKDLEEKDGDIINQFITTPIFEDNCFSPQEEQEEIPGYDYKEIINQKNRDWIKNKYKIEEKDLAKSVFNSIDSLYNSILEKSQNKSTIIIDDESQNNFYSYNTSQNIFFPEEEFEKNKKSFNPFFHFDKNEANNTKTITLHKSIALFPEKNQFNKKIKNSSIIFDKSVISQIESGEKNEEIRKPKLLSKKNYKNLKEKLLKDIYEQFTKKYGESGNVPFSILNEIIPYHIDERKNNNDEEDEIKEKEKELKLNGEIIKMNDYNQDNNNNNYNEINKELDKDIVTDPDSGKIWEDIGYDYLELLRKNKNKNRKIKKSPEEKWQTLSESLRRRYGYNLFQTIGSIIRAKHAINNDKIELKEKIKYYIILSNKDNEKIIKFLSKNEDDFEEEEDDNNNDFAYNEKEFVLDKNPEMNNSLENMEKLERTISYKIKSRIYGQENEEDYLMNKKMLKSVIQEKNILIENITNKEREGMLNKYKLRGFFFASKRKRIAMEEKDELYMSKRIQESIIKTKEKEINPQYISDITIKKTFHEQDIFEGNDPLFKPEKKSLCPLEEDQINWKIPSNVYNSDIENWEKINWRKLENINIFSRKAQPNLYNIRQGEYIGDCYFLSALGSLCNDYNTKSKQKGSYLKDLIQIIKRRGNKILYSVKFNINGKWKYVLVDNNFPYIIDNNGNNNFCFGSSFKKELWVSLIEKAWAKINGCYIKICGGHCKDAFDILTSAETEFIIIINESRTAKEEIWKKLKNASDNKYVICAGSRHMGLFENVGLISDHAYSIMNIYDINYKRKNLRLIKLRNPWGEIEFNGDWSKKKKKWNDELKRLVQFEGVKDDGIFYMSYDDFIGYFNSVEILKMREGYEIIASCKISKKEAYKCQMLILVINEDKKHLIINLYQKNPRIIRKNGKYYPEPVKSYIILAKMAKDNYIFIKSITNSEVHLGMEVELERGVYVIFCDVNYRFIYDEIYGYNINICSKKSKDGVRLQNETNKYNGEIRANIFQNILYDYFLQNKDNKKKIIRIMNYKKKNKNITFYKSNEFNEDFPFNIFFFINNNGESGLYFKCNLKYGNNNKNYCIYNNSDSSEFDKSFIKEIQNRYTIITFMGYKISDKLSINNSFTEIKEPFEHFIFNNKHSKEDENFYHYICSAEGNKGFILGLKKKREIKTIKITLEGLNIINPKYDKYLHQTTNYKLEINEKTIIINLRLKPGYENFNYSLDYS